MKAWARRAGVALLFAALVVVLLWFQGIVLREEHRAAEIPPPPAVGAGDRTVRVERRALPRVHVYPGFVEAVDPAQIAPRVTATILEVAGREGDPVAAGQTLVALEDRDARARLSQAEAAREGASARALEAQLAFDRAQRLLDADALTAQEWESARAARDAAQALLERARQAVEEAEAALSWFRLVAPFGGRILERHADPGHLATPGRAILAIYREDRLRFRVALPEERAGQLAVGEELDVDFAPPPSRRARVTRVLPPADPRTGTVTIHLALGESADLRPGLLGRLRVDVGEREALVVPASAVERIGQVERVRLLREGRLVPVTVRTGKAHGELVEVLSGLAEGEEVRVP